MLLQPRVVGRALDREVERDLDPRAPRGGDHRVEVVPRAELRVDRVVAALGRADRPRRTDVARLGACGVVAALAVRDARSGGSAAGRRRRSRARASAGSASATPAKPAPRAREELVPGAEARELAVDVDGKRRRDDLAVPVPGRSAASPSSTRRRRRRPSSTAPSDELAGEILLAGLDLAAAARPARSRCDRSTPRPRTASGPGGRRRTAPPQRSLPSGCERLFAPARVARRRARARAAERVVPVLEDGRVDLDPIAHRALDGVPSAVDHRLDRLDLDAWVEDLRKGHSGEILSRRVVLTSCCSNAHPASCCIRPRCRTGCSTSTRTASWTGSRPRDSHGGRSCRSGRRRASPARRTCRRRRSPARPRSSPSRTRRRRRPRPTRSAPRNAYWIDDWLAYGGTLDGPGALRARVAGTPRATPPSAACACSATCRSTSPRTAPTIARTRELFQTGAVAGVPPDALHGDGPAVGQPALRLERRCAPTRYRWWIERFRRTFELVDLTRVDHFRGFVSYWAVPDGEPTAEHGRWRRGPGADLFDAVERELGAARRRRRGSRRDHRAGRRGCATSSASRAWSCCSSRFGGDPANPHLPENHEEQSVVYTGTHDNDTTRGWWESLSEDERERIGPRPGRPRLVADRARLALARGARDRAAAGRARPRLARRA